LSSASREGKTRKRGKNKTRVSRRVGPRAKCVGGFTVFSITGNLRESEFVCVFIHDVADRRDARRAARGETKNKKKAAPFEPPLAASSSSSFGSRRLRRYRLRRFVERDVEKVFGYSLSVSVVAPSERRNAAHEFSAALEKNLATLEMSLPVASGASECV
jgi:hypothetical protein